MVTMITTKFRQKKMITTKQNKWVYVVHLHCVDCQSNLATQDAGSYWQARQYKAARLAKMARSPAVLPPPHVNADRPG